MTAVAPLLQQSSTNPQRRTWRDVLAVKELGIFVLLVVLCLFVLYKNPAFGERENVRDVAELVGMYGIFSIGQGIVIITGGIDLSMGSMFALLGVILSIMLGPWKWNWESAVLGTIGLGALLGALHGFLITKVRLQPFIVTLCGLLIYRGLARFIASDATMGFGQVRDINTFHYLFTGNFYGVPKSFVCLVIVAAIMWVVLHRTSFGRYLYAVGRNEDATRYSGINTNGVIAGTYIIAGTLTGIAAMYIAFYVNSVSPSTHGNFYELYAVAAAVLGGCSLRGGEGSIVGIILGTILLRVLSNLVILLGIDSSLDFAVMGGVILIGVIADRLLTSRRSVR